MKRHVWPEQQPRYAYDVEFASQLASYVVAGSSGGGGESQRILGRDRSNLIGVYPVRPRGIAVVRLSADAIEMAKVIDHPYAWDYSGTTGTFVAPERVLFVTLSTTGLHLIPINFRH